MEFVSDEEGKVVTGVKFEDTMLEGEPGQVRAIGTGHFTTMQCGVVGFVNKLWSVMRGSCDSFLHTSAVGV
jgi:hypothetical protein